MKLQDAVSKNPWLARSIVCWLARQMGPSEIARGNIAPSKCLMVVAICMVVPSCAVAPQPQSAQAVAAYEVPLGSSAERARFLSVLGDVAKSHSMHVDAATPDVLDTMAKAHPGSRLTMSAAVWRGAADDEPIASVMDGTDHPGRVWISFFRGKNPALNGRFRQATMRRVMQDWPGTLSLPIMPTGTIPLRQDLIRTPGGYVVDPGRAGKYKLGGDIEKR